MVVITGRRMKSSERFMACRLPAAPPSFATIFAPGTEAELAVGDDRLAGREALGDDGVRLVHAVDLDGPQLDGVVAP